MRSWRSKCSRRLNCLPQYEHGFNCVLGRPRAIGVVLDTHAWVLPLESWVVGELGKMMPAWGIIIYWGFYSGEVSAGFAFYFEPVVEAPHGFFCGTMTLFLLNSDTSSEPELLLQFQCAYCSSGGSGICNGTVV